jgi:hypothetical protein
MRNGSYDDVVRSVSLENGDALYSVLRTAIELDVPISGERLVDVESGMRVPLSTRMLTCVLLARQGVVGGRAAVREALTKAERRQVEVPGWFVSNILWTDVARDVGIDDHSDEVIATCDVIRFAYVALGTDAFPHLEALARQGGFAMRMTVLQGYEKAGVHAVPSILSILERAKRADLACWAISALGAIGPPATGATSMLTELSRSSNSEIRDAAVWALGQIENHVTD